MPSPLDIAHLSFDPPSAPGSYNRMIATQMAALTEFSHTCISYGAQWNSQAGAQSDRVVCVDSSRLTLAEKALLCLPSFVSRRWLNGVQDRRHSAYLVAARRELAALRPRLVVCYDAPKNGRILKAAMTWRSRIVLSQHGHSYFGDRAEALRTYSLKSFDAVVVLAASACRFDRARLPAYELPVAVIPNGVDTRRFCPVPDDRRRALREKHGLPPDKPIVLVLGRLVPKKGAHIPLLIWRELLARVPSAFLWVVGGGEPDYTRYLHDIAAARGVADSVKFHGRVPPDQTHECYQASDLYLFPTLCAEGMSLSLLEAMSAGLACVVSDHDSARAHFRPDEAEWVEEPNIPERFLEPLVRLLLNPASMREQGQRARQGVVSRFSEEMWLERLRRFYREQLDLVPAAP
jgi:glycosyltransferase involved in cell wall biosynthesis